MSSSDSSYLLSKYAFRRFLRETPAVFRPLAWSFRKDRRHAVVGPKTELVVEGMPRSANTFAYHAFRLAQGRDVKAAHHFHCPAQLLYGVRHKIPSLVLVREPLAVMTSLALRHPEFPLDRNLDDYIHFHSALLRYQDRLVVASFEEVTTDFGLVLAKVNRFFGCSFKLFHHDEENAARVTSVIQDINQSTESGNPLQVAMPSREKEKLKGPSRKQITQRLPKKGVHRARELYERFLHQANAQRAPGV